MSAIRILLAEDDPNLGTLLRDYLEVKGFTAGLFRDGELALEAFRAGKWDFCILDVMMPKRDGFSVAKEIRKLDAQVPVLFLTARNMLDDKYEGFSLGGDDYMTKPFSMEELLMRIRALLRRVRPGEGMAAANSPENERFQIGRYRFDYPTRELHFDTQTHRLTSREAELLRLLAQQPNAVLKRDVALRLIWGDDSYFNARSMDVFITKLRKYLRDDPQLEIMNVHGLGYKLLVREG